MELRSLSLGKRRLQPRHGDASLGAERFQRDQDGSKSPRGLKSPNLAWMLFEDDRANTFCKVLKPQLSFNRN